MAVSLLDAWASTGATGSSSPGSFTVSAGAGERMLIYAAGAQGDTTDEEISAVTYGGQAMTRVVEEVGFDTTNFIAPYTSLWRLDEAGLAAASGSAFVVTSDLNAGSFRSLAACYDGVDQTTPIVDSAGASTFDSTANSNTGIDIALTTVADGAVVSFLSSDLPAASTGGITYASPLASQASENANTGGVQYAVGGVTPNTGTSVTADLTFGGTDGNFRANAHVALSLRPAPASTTVNLTRATSGSTARALTASKTAALTRAGQGSVARSLGVALAARATGSMVTGGRAEAVVGVTARATGTMVTGGSANGLVRTGARATGSMVTGGRANAALPATPIPSLPLADSFQVEEAPVFLIDLGFDSGDLNIWTLPVPGRFNDKDYVPLAGLDGSFAVTNSLDVNTLDASVQLNGNSDELRALALTENYRGRPARVLLGNLNADNEIESAEVIFLGVIANMPISDDRNTSTVSVLVDSVFRNLSRPTVNRLTSAYLSLRSQDDTFLDFVETARVLEPRFGQA